MKTPREFRRPQLLPLPSFETKHSTNPFYIWGLMGKEIEKILIFILSKLL